MNQFPTEYGNLTIDLSRGALEGLAKLVGSTDTRSRIVVTDFEDQELDNLRNVLLNILERFPQSNLDLL